MLQTTSGFLWPDMFALASNTTLTLDGVAEKVAHVFRASRSGTIEAVRFPLGSVPVGANLAVGLQGVDLATGFPDGVNLASGTVAVAGVDADTWPTATFAAGREVAAGDYLAVVIGYDGVAGDVRIPVGGSGTLANCYVVQDAGSGYSMQSRTPVLALKYTDGLYRPIPGVAPGLFGGLSFNSGSTTNERALRFRLPFPARATGAAATLAVNAGDYEVNLYDAAGSSLVSAPAVKGVRRTTSPATHAWPFSASVTLAANTTYYLGIRALTASSVTLYHLDTPDPTLLGQMPGGAEAYYASRGGAGSWGEIPTRRPAIQLVLDQFDDAIAWAGDGVNTYSRGRLVNL